MPHDRLVLGIDPGSRCMGYGLVRERSGVLTLVEAGTVRPDGESMSARLGLMYSRVVQLLQTHSPQAVAVENVFFARNSDSALKLGQARGAVLAACGVHGVEVFGYEPTLVKKSLVGAGRAEKSQVSFMVGQLLGVRPDWAEDAGDALAVAICHHNHCRFLAAAAAGQAGVSRL
ncbi:MAG: crossover junction endodeoxyribonuclease RuvC [Desulfovibrionales bacterium]|nr:crossover junction endodeoxyribonuclease RuvC [Desulfovibrionales bacterium]